MLEGQPHQDRLAAELARKSVDLPRQAQALEHLSDVLWGTGNFQEMPALLDAAAEMHRQAGNMDQFAWDTAQATRPYALLGQSDVALARLQKLLVSLAELTGAGSSEIRTEIRTRSRTGLRMLNHWHVVCSLVPFPISWKGWRHAR